MLARSVPGFFWYFCLICVTIKKRKDEYEGHTFMVQGFSFVSNEQFQYYQ